MIRGFINVLLENERLWWRSSVGSSIVKQKEPLKGIKKKLNNQNKYEYYPSSQLIKNICNLSNMTIILEFFKESYIKS